MRRILNNFFLFIIFLLVVEPAYANAGVPMIFITLPYMIIGLIPIIIIEAYILVKKIGSSFKQTVKISTIANVVSTIIGMPITWLLLVLIEMVTTDGGRAYGLNTPLKKFLAVTLQAPWLIPYEGDFYWMIPTATLSLLIPFFFASWFIEYKMAQKMLKRTDLTLVKRGVFLANVTSYTILFILTIIWLIIAVTTH